MSKAFVSILGTNDYLEARHKFPDEFISEEPVKYIQEELVKRYCQEWKENDEIRIFLTEEAEKKNWLNDGHEDKNGNALKNTGLKETLNNLALQATVKSYKIPVGNNEKEIWEIFDIISNSFKNSEEVILDVTHSFRSLPMLLTVMLNYTCQIKNIKVIGIYYAAFETLGPIPVVREIPVDKRIAPILDLTPLVKLQEWTNAVHEFKSNGNMKDFKKLLEEIHKESWKKEDVIPASQLKNVGNDLEKITDAFATIRIEEILNLSSRFSKRLRELLLDLEAHIQTKPFSPLLEEIASVLLPISGTEGKMFSSKGFEAQKHILEWYVETGKYQQALTLAREYILSKYLIEIMKCDSDLMLDKDKRFEAENELGEFLVYLKRGGTIPGRKGDYVSIWRDVINLRNDINHAGMKRTKKQSSKDETITLPSKALIKNTIMLIDNLVSNF